MNCQMRHIGVDGWSTGRDLATSATGTLEEARLTGLDEPLGELGLIVHPDLYANGEIISHPSMYLSDHICHQLGLSE